MESRDKNTRHRQPGVEGGEETEEIEILRKLALSQPGTTLAERDEKPVDTKKLQSISGRLLQQDDSKSLYEEILEAAIVLLKSDAGSLQMVDGETGKLMLLAWRGFHPESALFWESVGCGSNSSCGASMRSFQRTVVPDIESCDFMAGSEDLEGLRRSGLRSVQTTPLVSRSGRIVGMISTHWKHVHEPAEREIRLLDVLARQAADLIERGSAERAIRISEEKYRMLFESIDEGFCLIEMIFDEGGNPSDYRFLEYNPAFENHTGLRGMIGRTVRDFYPDHEAHWFEIYGRIALTGQPERFEEIARGFSRVFDVYAFRVGQPEQRRVAVLFNDITERKEREAHMAFLVDLSKRLPEVSTSSEAMDFFGERIGAMFDASVCAFISIDGDANQASISDEWRAAGAPSLIGKYDLGNYVTDEFGIRMSSGDPVVVDDVATDARVGNKKGFAALGIGSFVNVPLIRNGRWFFSIGVYRQRPQAWQQSQVSLLNEISTRIWNRIERVRTEQAMAASEERLRTLFDSMNEAFVIKEAILDEGGKVVDYRFIECNPAFSIQTGIRDPRGHTVLELMPKVGKLWLENYEKVITSGEPTQFEAQFGAPDRWLSVSVSRLGGAGSLKVAIVFMDISERKRSEAALKRVQEELEVRVVERTQDLGQALKQLRAESSERRKLEDARHDLLKRLVTTQEEERKRISRDLHDNLGQYLTAVMLNLQTLQGEMDQGLKPGKSFEDLKDIVASLMKAAHRQAWELRPAELDHFGLEAALRNYVRDWSERAGIPASFETANWGDRRIHPDFEIALYRIVQEALTNVARHANAATVSVTLKGEGGTNVTVLDDGRGFDTAAINGRLGLLGMKERVLLVGGTLEIKSVPGQGTAVSAHVNDPGDGEISPMHC